MADLTEPPRAGRSVVWLWSDASLTPLARVPGRSRWGTLAELLRPAPNSWGTGSPCWGVVSSPTATVEWQAVRSMDPAHFS